MQRPTLVGPVTALFAALVLLVFAPVEQAIARGGLHHSGSPLQALAIPVCPEGLVVGESAECSIDAPGEIDAYAFPGAFGDRVRARVARTSGDVELRLEVRLDGVRICTPSSIGPLVGLDCELSGAGSYTLHVIGVGAGTGGYRLHLQRLNDPGGCAGALTYGGAPVAAAIADAPDLECHVFEGADGDRIRLRWTRTAGTPGFVVDVLRPDGTRVCPGPLANPDGQVECVLDVAGPHAVLVRPFPASGGAYVMHLQRLNPPVGCASAPSYGFAPAVGTIARAPESECHRFEGAAGDRIRVRWTRTTGATGFIVEVLRADGTRLCSGGLANPDGQAECVLDTTGPHTVLVTPFPVGIGRYALSLQRLNPPVGCADGLSYGGPPVETTIADVPEPECHRFTAAAGDHVRLRWTRLTGLTGFMLEVLRPDGTRVCLGGANADGQVDCVLDTGGTHTALLTPFPVGTGAYRLELECTEQCVTFHISGVTPARGGNAGAVTVELTGGGFVPGSVVRLLDEGTVAATGTQAHVFSLGRMRARLNLRGLAPGGLTLSLTHPDGRTATAPFTVLAGGEARLTLELVGPPVARAGREVGYSAVVGNAGTIDVDFVLVEVSGGLLNDAIVGLAPGMKVALQTSRTTFDPGCHELRGTARTPLTKAQACAEALARVKAGRLKLGDLVHQAEEKTKALREAGCLKEGGSSGLGCKDLFDERHALLIQIKRLMDNLLQWCKYLLDPDNECPDATSLCAEVRAEIEAALRRLRTAGMKIEQPDLTVLPETPRAPPGPVEQTQVVVAVRTVCANNSWDPNEKVGVAGFGAPRYVRPGVPIPYTIFFENLAAATASAREVIVTDRLDPALDWSSVALESVRIGSDTTLLGPETQDFATAVDMRPQGGSLFARVEGHLDPGSGLLTWRFDSLDPDTGEPPEDELAGFLPPNLVPPRGEGSVTYSVRPKAGLPTGTEIRNAAAIVFDANSPVVTGDWLTTIDDSPPESAVQPLVADQSSASFDVAWSGTDAGAGVRAFTIFVSEDGGPFVPWLETPARSATFTGRPGVGYRFYSRAVDQVGNLEGAPDGHDTATRVLNVSGGGGAGGGDSGGDNTGGGGSSHGDQLSTAQLRADLASDLRAVARALSRLGIRGILRRRTIPHRFTPLTAGTITVRWRAVRLTVGQRPSRVLARGTATANAAGSLTVKVRVTGRGRALFTSNRRVPIVVKATFRRPVGSPVSAAARATLRRR